MAILGKEALGRNALKRKTIDVPEWDGQIIIRELNGHGAGLVAAGGMEISQARQNGTFSPQMALRWLAQTVASGWVNEDGSYVLQGSDDIDQLLATQKQSTLEQIASEIRILSGMEKAKEDDPEPLDDAKKNLTETTNTASGSA